MRVVIEARIDSGSTGGVETVIIGLASGLSSLSGSADEYLFLTLPGQDEWLTPFLRPPCFPVRATPSLRQKAKRIPGLRRAVKAARRAAPEALGPVLTQGLARSDGSAERLRADVVHFPYQAGFLTDIPFVYQPHDLQHLHLPQYFSAAEIRSRETVYRALCNNASLIAVTSNWVRSDLISQYELDPAKIRVIPHPPILANYATPSAELRERTRDTYRLPERFLLYPAQSWPHKNHLMLLEALALLRHRGLDVPLVCCGTRTAFFSQIATRVSSLGIADLTSWLGFVPTNALSSLYAMATAVVVPTLFEAASGPVSEAFQAGTAVACSNVTSLPEQAGDAALIFDPNDAGSIASAIERIWTDEELRSDLIVRGRRRVADLSWRSAASAFRAAYQEIAGA